MTPVHPGLVLHDEVLPALGVSVSEAARELRVSREALHDVLRGTAAISPEMALRLGKFCGNGAAIWLRLQQAYDLWQAERALQGELAQIPTRRAAADAADPPR